MKTIQLQSLTLRNWRGEKEHTTHFASQGITRICGRNGLGKSRHMDAFLWLLFGKDSQDRKDYNLRTIIDRQPLHRVECSVEAELLIDGQPLTIKREYREKWVKPRGQAEEVLSGNVTECTWNGTPVRVTDFKSRVADIIDEQVFRMITSTDYFVNLKPDLQRTALLQLAQPRSDHEIAAENPEFLALLDTLSGKSLTDYRREAAAEKRRLRAALQEIEPRIDQTLKLAPPERDWQALQDQLSQAKDNEEKLRQALADEGKQDQLQQQTRRQLNQQLDELKQQVKAAIDQLQQQYDSETAELSAERTAIESQLKTLNTQLTDHNIDRTHTEKRIQQLTDEVQQLTDELNQLRNEWRALREESCTQSDHCPHCGQLLPPDQLAKAREEYEAYRTHRLQANQAKGKGKKELLDAAQANLDEARERLQQIQDETARANAKLEQLYTQLEAHPFLPRRIAAFDQLPADRRKHFETLQDELTQAFAELDTPRDDNHWQQQYEAAQAEVRNLEAQLADRTAIQRAQAEVKNLEAEGKQLADQLAQLERTEYTAARFARTRIEDCETRINSLFHNVRWQLFDTTLDGNDYEVCIPLIDGIPYGTCNTARQINAGIDIASTFARFYEVYAPMFIDRAESVNEFISSNSQMIFLQVTTDPQLTIR